MAVSVSLFACSLQNTASLEPIKLPASERYTHFPDSSEQALYCLSDQLAQLQIKVPKAYVLFKEENSMPEANVEHTPRDLDGVVETSLMKMHRSAFVYFDNKNTLTSEPITITPMIVNVFEDTISTASSIGSWANGQKIRVINVTLSMKATDENGMVIGKSEKSMQTYLASKDVSPFIFSSMGVFSVTSHITNSSRVFSDFKDLSNAVTYDLFKDMSYRFYGLDISSTCSYDENKKTSHFRSIISNSSVNKHYQISIKNKPTGAEITVSPSKEILNMQNKTTLYLVVQEARNSGTINIGNKRSIPFRIQNFNKPLKLNKSLFHDSTESLTVKLIETGRSKNETKILASSVIFLE